MASSSTAHSSHHGNNSKRSKSSERLVVTVIGGGNSSPIFATLAATAGHKVYVLTRKPSDWISKGVGFMNQDEGYIDGAKELRADIENVTSDPKECIPQSDLIFIAGVPIHHNPVVLAQIKPFIRKDGNIVHIGSICAYGGFNWVASRALGEGNYSLFGTQLIPWACGTIEYGKTGVVYGAKRLLRIATEDGQDKHGVKPILAEILQMPFLTDTDFLASSFWPNNPSLHPPILYGLFKNWDGKTPLIKKDLPILIYKDLRTDSSITIVGLDDDLSAIVDALAKKYPHNKHLKESFRMKKCVMENYEDQILNSYDTVTCIMTNKAFGSHKIPYTSIDENHVVPTLKHKFFETDLPYGLVTFKDVALMLDVDTPWIDRIILWNQKLIDKEYLVNGKLSGKDIGECVVPSNLGLTSATLEAGNRSSQ
jgi:opine dehydrogenase